MLSSAGSLFIGADSFVRAVKVLRSFHSLSVLGFNVCGKLLCWLWRSESRTRLILWKMFSQISSLNFHTNVDPDRHGIFWWIFNEFHCTYSDSVWQPMRDSASINRVFHNKRCIVVTIIWFSIRIAPNIWFDFNLTVKLVRTVLFSKHATFHITKSSVKKKKYCVDRKEFSWFCTGVLPSTVHCVVLCFRVERSVCKLNG